MILIETNHYYHQHLFISIYQHQSLLMIQVSINTFDLFLFLAIQLVDRWIESKNSIKTLIALQLLTTESVS